MELGRWGKECEARMYSSSGSVVPTVGLWRKGREVGTWDPVASLPS